MKTATSTILFSSILAFASAASGPASPVISGTGGFGTATVTVLHSVTNQPLARMPVTVRSVISPDSVGAIYWTDRNGNALITNLLDGRYEAFVDFNNNVSEVVRFEIIGDFHPHVVIHFNPEID
jgi:hypothetical protein